MNQQIKLLVPDVSTLDALPYRAAIDRVATLRAQVIRVALNITLLSAASKDQDRQRISEALEKTVKTMSHTVQVVEGQKVFTSLPEPLSQWIAGTCGNFQSEVRELNRTIKLVESLSQVAMGGEPVTDKDIERLVDLGGGAFFEAVSKICNTLWQTIEQGRSEKLAEANRSAANLAATLQTLSGIGRHVRSVSINASVEASRAGDAGRGLAIIAQEFKKLGEEINDVIVLARKDIDVLSSN